MTTDAVYELALRFLRCGGHISWGEFAELSLEDQAAFSRAADQLRAEEAAAHADAIAQTFGLDADTQAQVATENAAQAAVAALGGSR